MFSSPNTCQPSSGSVSSTSPSGAYPQLSHDRLFCLMRLFHLLWSCDTCPPFRPSSCKHPYSTSNMLTHLWKCYSAVHAALAYFLYGALVPPFIRNFFSTRESPDDLEGCGRLQSKNDSPTIAKDNSSGSAKEDQVVLPGEIADPVFYEPPFNETLSQGSTSLIARVKPGIVVKCPRYSWWHSEAAENHPTDLYTRITG